MGVCLALLAFWLACAVGLGADDGEPGVTDSAWDPALGGRFSVVSEAGGAVWSFQPGGELFVLGPGDLIAEGTWSPGPLPGEVDAVVVVPVTEQVLSILGSLSPDGSRLAISVTASEAATPLGGIPWPPASRLVGEQVGLVADPSPKPDASARCVSAARLGRRRHGRLGPLRRGARRDVRACGLASLSGVGLAGPTHGIGPAEPAGGRLALMSEVPYPLTRMAMTRLSQPVSASEQGYLMAIRQSRGEATLSGAELARRMGVSPRRRARCCDAWLSTASWRSARRATWS